MPLNADGETPVRNLDGLDHAIGRPGRNHGRTTRFYNRLLMAAVHIEARRAHDPRKHRARYNLDRVHGRSIIMSQNMRTGLPDLVHHASAMKAGEHLHAVADAEHRL